MKGTALSTQPPKPKTRTFPQHPPTDTPDTGKWTTQSSARLYGVQRWGLGYFDVGEDGFVSVTAPTESGPQTVSMKQIVDGLADRDLSMPVMLRIENATVSATTPTPAFAPVQA